MVHAVYNVPIYIKRMIHFAYIYPYMTYCLPAWGATHNSYVTRIILVQKRAIRQVCGASHLSHNMPLASHNQLLLFSDVYKLQTALLMHQVFYTKCYSKINVLSNIFVHRFLHINIRNTSHNFPICYIRTECYKRSIFVSGIAIWNSISLSIKSISSVKKFKNNLLCMFFNLYQ